MALAPMQTRYSGFVSISWCSISISKCFVVGFGASAGGSWALDNDDSIAQTGVLVSGISGEITITGRQLGLIGMSYMGRIGDMTMTLSGAESVANGDTLTLQDAQLIGIDSRVPTDNLGEVNWKFTFSKAEGDVALYAIVPPTI